MIPQNRRLASIDAFRGLTMLLMIFVNDLVLDERIPRWLEHAERGEDRLGLADTVFPAFLFIVGLSIPMAIRNERQPGVSRRHTLVHILLRSLALLIMGIFLVNYEEYTTGPALLPRFWWLLIVTIAFFFVWLKYPSSWPKAKTMVFRSIGILALVIMAIVYRGGSAADPTWMETHWYGILGLIGWAYLTCALLYFFIGDRTVLLAIAFLYFLGLSIGFSAGWDPPFKHYLSLGDTGGLSAFTMAGVMTTVYYRKGLVKGDMNQRLLWLVAYAMALVIAGFALRPLRGIAKLEVTPSWVLICTGISIACFVLIAYVTDDRGWQKWYGPIKPAGTATLTCYLLPYIHFSILKLLGEQARLPAIFRTGAAGIIKSLAFAFLIVLLTGMLEKRKIKLAI